MAGLGSCQTASRNGTLSPSPLVWRVDGALLPPLSPLPQPSNAAASCRCHLNYVDGTTGVLQRRERPKWVRHPNGTYFIFTSARSHEVGDTRPLKGCASGGTAGSET